MVKTGLKYFYIIILLIMYINRSLFVAMPESEISYFNHENQHEINSVLELIIAKASGKSNLVDEDGDSSESYAMIQFVEPFIHQIFYQNLVFHTQLSSNNREIHPTLSETIPSLFICEQIEHPPQA